MTTRATEWVAYDAAMATYRDALEDYNAAMAAYESGTRSISGRLKEIQDRCAALTAAIESKVSQAWAEVAGNTAWLTSQLEGFGGAGSLAETVERIVESRFYVATFVTDWGEESAPSPPSDLLDVDQNDTCALTRPAVVTGESYATRNITKWRIYRSNTGSQTSVFQFVDELPITTTDYVDAKKGSELGEPCPTLTWLEPAYRMDAESTSVPKPVIGSDPYLRGAVAMPNGVMAAFFDNTVAFCEPYVPYAWPVEYQITTEYPIVGLGVFGQTLVICTTANPYFAYGADSASMTAQKLDANQACIAARTIASVAGGVMYASPDGLVLASQGGVRVVTEGMYNREDWLALNPAAMFGLEHEGVYYLFTQTETLVFGAGGTKLGTLPIVATSAYVDRLTDTLYIANGTAIQAVYGGASRRTGYWRSAKVALPLYAGLAWLQVMGDQTPSNPVTVRWYGDGVLIHTATVTNILPQRLPPGKFVEHEVEVEGAVEVTSVTLASSTAELQRV